MAPNRKQIAVALDPLVDNTQLVQAKYLPLTHSSAKASSAIATAIAPQEAKTVIHSSAPAAHEYWNWPSTTRVAKKDLFSAAHVEENARRDCARRQQQQQRATQTVVRAANPAPANYWEERVEARVVHSEANASERTGYWEWPEETRVNALQIALIVQEELARQLLSAEAIEQLLVKDAATHKHTVRAQSNPQSDDYYWGWETATTVRAKPAVINESYWQWETPLVDNAAQKQHLVASILQYEANRQLFAGDHIAANLQTDVLADAATVELKESSDSYWAWPAVEHSGQSKNHMIDPSFYL